MKIVLLQLLFTAACTASNFNTHKFAGNYYLAVSEFQQNFVLSAPTATALFAFLRLGTTSRGMKGILARDLGLSINDQVVRDGIKNWTSTYGHEHPHLQYFIALYYNNELNLNGNFLDTAANVFRSDVVPFNFKHKDSLVSLERDWFKLALPGSDSSDIPGDHITPNTNLILDSAAHFSSKWAIPFVKPDDPVKEYFYVNPLRRVFVEFLTVIDQFKYREYPDQFITAVEIPFKDTGALIIYQSHKLRENNTYHYLEFLLNNPPQHFESVFVQIPKFSLDSRTMLKKATDVVGIKTLFENHYDLITNKKLYINLNHKVALDFNYNGVNVDSAGVPSTNKPGSGYTKSFIVQKPFLFTIRNNNGDIEFIGKCSDPTKPN